MPRTDRLRHFMISWPFPVVVISRMMIKKPIMDSRMLITTTGKGHEIMK